MRFSDSPHNSETSDMRDARSEWTRDITRKSTWIFKIWLRFAKYESALFREWNLYEYGPVVVKLEQFEVQLSKTWPPLHSGNMTPTHEGWNGGLEWSIDLGPKYKLKISTLWVGHFCRNCFNEIDWKCLQDVENLGSFLFLQKTDKEYMGPAILKIIIAPKARFRKDWLHTVVGFEIVSCNGHVMPFGDF